MRPGALRLLVGAALLSAAAACGSISSSAPDGGTGGASATGGNVGSAGTTGSGGTQGSGGTGGSGTTCAQIQNAYKVALVKARACMAGATNQCQKMASTELGCNGCPTFVNDDSSLGPLENAWNQGQCDQTQVCTGIACLSPKAATCRTGDGGGALCVDSIVATP